MTVPYPVNSEDISILILVVNENDTVPCLKNAEDSFLGMAVNGNDFVPYPVNSEDIFILGMAVNGNDAVPCLITADDVSILEMG